MSKPVSRLGRGLSGMINSAVNPPAIQPSNRPNSNHPPATDGVVAVRSLRIDEVVPNPRQPRTVFDDSLLQELAASIRVSGILQPITVRSRVGGGFELVAGERRLRAAKLAGLDTVPALIRDVSDAESLELALVENLQRDDLGALERATAYQQYLDAFRSTPEMLATRLGESRSNIVNYIRLLRLPTEIQEMIRTDQLSMGHARALINAGDGQNQLRLAKLAVRRNLSVRQVEELAKLPTVAERADVEKAPDGGSRHLQRVADTLSKSLGVPVELRSGRKLTSGRMVIRYRSLEEFDRIARQLGCDAALE